MKINMESEYQQAEETVMTHDVSRRRFFQLAGGVTAAGILIASCRRTPPDTVYVGSGDTALLNYLFIVESVLAAFYTRSLSVGPQYYGLTKSELELLADLRDHQLAHKEFIKKFLGASAMSEIVTDLSPVTFADRTNTLQHAIMLEDLATAAYIGAAKRFTDTNNVSIVAKMLTVQARHSAYVRDILTPNTFADSTVVNTDGLNQELAPSVVLAALKPYIQTKLDVTKLPA